MGHVRPSQFSQEVKAAHSIGFSFSALYHRNIQHQQGETHTVWHPVRGQQRAKKQENVMHDKEHDRSLRTDRELVQMLGGDDITVDIFPNLTRTLNTYPRSLVNLQQQQQKKKHGRKSHLGTSHQIAEEW